MPTCIPTYPHTHTPNFQPAAVAAIFKRNSEHRALLLPKGGQLWSPEPSNLPIGRSSEANKGTLTLRIIP